MTPTTKSGKECLACLGIGRFGNHQRARGWDTCGYCHGLGKVFAPGDALTAVEAEMLEDKGCKVEERVSGVSYAKWVPFIVHRSEWNDLYEFRLAHTSGRTQRKK